jgi:methionyl-tRNA synthetase
VRIIAILLQPVMPDKAHECLDTLGVYAGRRRLKDADFREDFGYGVPLRPVGRGPYNSLFPPLALEG